MESTAMTDSIDQAKQELAQRKRYKRLFYAVLTVAIVGYVVSIAVWNQVGGDLIPLAGIGIYWGGLMVGLVIIQFSPVAVDDERDKEIGRKAAAHTVGIAGAILILGGPGAATLEQTGVYTAPDWFGGMMAGYALLFGVFAVSHWYVKRQHS